MSTPKSQLTEEKAPDAQEQYCQAQQKLLQEELRQRHSKVPQSKFTNLENEERDEVKARLEEKRRQREAELTKKQLEEEERTSRQREGELTKQSKSDDAS